MTTLSRTGVEALHRRIQHEIDTGNLTSAQVAIGLEGEVAEARSFGEAADTSRFIIFSATKTLVAMALLPHLADGTVDLTAPVAHYVPEFGHHGKSDVPVRQLLTMQGGFPQATIGADRWGDGSELVSRGSMVRIERAGFAPASAFERACPMGPGRSSSPILPQPDRTVEERASAPISARGRRVISAYPSNARRAAHPACRPRP